MQAIAAFVVSLLDAVEEEGRILRRSVVNTSHAVAAAFFAAAAAICGLAMLLYGVYLEGSALGRPSLGAFLAGVVAFVIAAATIRLTKPRRPG